MPLNHSFVNNYSVLKILFGHILDDYQRHYAVSGDINY